MTDNQLKAIMFSTLEAAVASAIAGASWPSGSNVVEAQQPTLQGVPSTPTIFYYRSQDLDYGFPAITDTFDATRNQFNETTSQAVETAFMITALCLQDPNNLALPTPADMVKYIKRYLSAPAIIQSLAAQGVYQLRARDIKLDYFEDDRSNIESIPAVQIIWRHVSDLTLTVPVVNNVIPASGPGPNPAPGSPVPPQTGPNYGTFPI